MGAQELSLSFQYDRDADVMYFTMGAPREAISEEVADGVFKRLDPESNEVIGVTIIDFAKRASGDLSPISVKTTPAELVGR